MRSLCVAAFLMLVSASGFGEGVTASGNQGNAAGTHALKVFDATGKRVGLLASYSGADGVYVTANGTTTFVRIGREPATPGTARSRFVWATASDVGFDSADYSGQPIVPFDSNWPRPSVAIRQGSEVVVYIGADTNSDQIKASSFLNGTACSARSLTTQSVRPESSFSVSQRYPEPLTIGY
jgi:hypothetical protein